MKRTFTFFAVILIAVVALALYRLSYEVQRLEAELSELDRAIVDHRHSVAVLRAEWAYLTRPQALQGLVARHLDQLAPVTAGQVVDVTGLPPAAARDKYLQMRATWASAPETEAPARSSTRPALAERTNHR